MKELVLEKHLYRTSAAFDAETLASLQYAELSSYCENHTMRMVAELRTTILRHRLAAKTHEVRMSYPASPWEHFKHKHQFKWWMRGHVRRAPIKFTAKIARITITSFNEFPDASIIYPPELGKIVIPIQETNIF